MTTYPLAQQTYNNARKPHHPVDFFYFKALNKVSGLPIDFFFSNRDKSESVTVRSVADGSDVTRAYLGGKHILKVPPIKSSQALTVDEHEIEANFNSTQIRDMIEGHHMQRAYFEWHQGQLDRRGGSQLITRPVCELFGFVNGVKEKKGAKDRKTGLTDIRFVISLIGRIGEFEYANNALRSREQGMTRSGDHIFEYVEDVGDWGVGWGKDIHKHSDHGKPGVGGNSGSANGGGVPGGNR